MVKRLTSTAVLVVLVSALASGANAFTYDKRTYFTFDQPVALPDTTLPAGTYMFRLANRDASRDVIQVTNRSGTVSYAILQAVPAYRADTPQDAEIRFHEITVGGPAIIDAFWYVGEQRGFQFVYTKQRFAALTSVQPVEVTEAAAAEALDDVPPSDPQVSFPEAVANALAESAAAFEEPASDQPARSDLAEPETQVARVDAAHQTAEPSEADARAERRDQLPRTASPLALVLFGALATALLGFRLLGRS